MIRLAIVLAVAAFAGSAAAQRLSPVDGNRLLGICTAKATTDCDSYLSGFADAMAAGGRTKAGACIPMAVTGTELRGVAVKYMRNHPEVLYHRAGLVVFHALSEAYPCKP